jgi:5-dehydro-2-deoxygluconokinase
VQASGHELLLEIIPPPGLPRAADTVVRAIERLYNLQIFPEWWKLEPMAAAEWAAIDALIEVRDPYCRGVLLLGQAANADTLAAGFAEARESRTCRGFAVGRTIFHEPSRKWLAGDIDDAALVRAVRANFEALIRAWHAARDASPGAAKGMKVAAA